ncbi:hypothetical protein BOTNAR_0376g00030 [Botryotinia narcissicola]|uniref:Aminoglycoside phosphotransferase domain-containing protein n=1 Tax=Botryotinia narcissicola TaxID=278944 RepID=A0A4Z1HQ58_9HELO|nr:hypothetical protein BOTNAR_0376g00030 [Botryotinia narcissicola]
MDNVAATIEMFCRNIKFGHDIQDCEVRQGGNHNVIMFSYVPFAFSDPTRPPPSNHRQFCILRTKKEFFEDSIDMACENTKRTVAAMHSYGEGGTHPSKLPIPAVLVYDAMYDNAIGCPYIIQQRAAGNDLQKWYEDLEAAVPAEGPYDLTERLKIAEEMAVFIASMENSFQFQEYGDLIHGASIPEKNMAFSGEEMEMRIRGPYVGDVQVPGSLNHIEFFESLISARIAKTGISQAAYEELAKLKKIFEQMKEWELLDEFSTVPTLYHRDLYARNVIFDCAGTDGEMKLTAVIDWDETVVIPRIMTRKPPCWLWTSKMRHEEHRRAIKEHFYEHMERLLPGYREDAEGDARFVRALYVYAFWGPNYGYHSELSFAKLLEECYEMWVKDMF